MLTRRHNSNHALALFAFLLAAGLALASPAARAVDQAQQQPAPAAQPPSLQGSSQATPAGDAAKPQPPPVNKEEEDAYQAFAALKSEDAVQIISLGQAFLSKYAISFYRPMVYAKLEVTYLDTNQLDKLVSTGQLALNEDPDNVDVLAVMASTLPRISASGLDASQRLDLAERYARRTLQVAALLPKPQGYTEEQFDRARNEKLAMAHTGLGLVYYRRGDTADSVSELDMATKPDPTPEPIDFFLLGDGDMKLQKYPEAAAAFDRCAKAQWSADWQNRCKAGEMAAQKATAKQPPAPAKP